MSIYVHVPLNVLKTSIYRLESYEGLAALFTVFTRCSRVDDSAVKTRLQCHPKHCKGSTLEAVVSVTRVQNLWRL
jgi:hypothetical protein